MNLTNLDILADMIIGAREDKGYSQRQLSTLIGVSNSEISMLENCKRQKPNLEILKKISEILDLDYEEIMEVLGYINTGNFDDNTITLSKEEKEFIVSAIKEKWLNNTPENFRTNMSDSNEIYNTLFPRINKIASNENIELLPKAYTRLKKIGQLSEEKQTKFIELMDWFIKYENNGDD